MEQAALDRRVRFRIYQHFAERAEAPSSEAIASELGLPAATIEGALVRLAEAHTIVLAPGSTSIWMAHPFSAVPTPYPVQAGERRYWANCAWDALAIPVLLGVDTETPTHCADCHEPMTLRVRSGQVQPLDAVVHFAVPPRRFWENVGFT